MLEGKFIIFYKVTFVVLGDSLFFPFSTKFSFIFSSKKINTVYFYSLHVIYEASIFDLNSLARVEAE